MNQQTAAMDASEIRLIQPNEDLPIHELCTAFPPMPAENRGVLKVSIKATNGPLEPGTVHKGELVDGGHRWEICKELGIPFPVREWNGEGGTLANYVKIKNADRRHLTSSQLAVSALKFEKHLAAEAKERQRQGKKIDNSDPSGNVSGRESEDGEARKQAADMLNTNSHYVSDAKRLQEENPELLEKVRLGEFTIPEAIRQLDGKRGKSPKSAKGRSSTALTGPAIAGRLKKLVSEVQPLVDDKQHDKVVKALGKLKDQARQECLTKVQLAITALKKIEKDLEPAAVEAA
jgi:ParB-like chromosome segregation protein Spo0J